MSEQVHIGFYNVENLFDTTDDPRTKDDDYTTHGKKKWNEERYNNKIRKLGFVLDQMSEKYPLAFLGLAEIENKKVMEDLLAADQLKAKRYKIIHYQSLDERGIDVGFVYDSKYFFPTHSEPIRISLSNHDGTADYTRDMLYVSGNLKNEHIHVFVVHLPSKRENDINKPKRELLLQHLRFKIEEIQAQDKAAHIVVMGDFNDNPNQHMIKKNLKTKANIEHLEPDELYNPMEELRKQGLGSLVYKGKWLLFDQMMFSKAFFYKKEKVELEEVAIFGEHFLTKWEGPSAGFPFRTYVGSKYQNGYSDHFPVYAKVKLD